MFKSMIDLECRVHWSLDNLPVAVRNDELGYVSRGYPVGCIAQLPRRKSLNTIYLIMLELWSDTAKMRHPSPELEL